MSEVAHTGALEIDRGAEVTVGTVTEIGAEVHTDGEEEIEVESDVETTTEIDAPTTEAVTAAVIALETEAGRESQGGVQLY